MRNKQHLLSPQALKKQVGIEEVLHDLKVEGRKGRYICPLHESAGATLIATNARGRATCSHPGCPIKHVDAIELIQHLTGCTFAEAMGRLHRLAQSPLSRTTIEPDEADEHAGIPKFKPLLKTHRSWIEDVFGSGADWVVSCYGLRSWRRSHFALPIDESETSFCFVPMRWQHDQVFYKGAVRGLQLFPQRGKYLDQARKLIFCAGEIETLVVAWELYRQQLYPEWAALCATNAYRSLDKLSAWVDTLPLAAIEQVVLLLPNGREAESTRIALVSALRESAPQLHEISSYPLSSRVIDRTSFLNFYRCQGGLRAFPFDAQRCQAQVSVRPTANTAILQRMTEAATEIYFNKPQEIEFLHTVLCQVSLPRNRVDERRFERSNGYASLLIEAGSLWTGEQWEEQPLPYGTIPRLILVYLSSEAVRTRSPVIDVGRSLTEFMNRLDIGQSGGAKGRYGSFKQQLKSLVASRFLIGMTLNNKAVTIDSKPISKFLVWNQDNSEESTAWPGFVELSSVFHTTLLEHAVPLDPRALAALKHTSLGLDIYTWLVNRLPRIGLNEDLFLSWANLHEQFGQDYARTDDFIKKFKKHIHDVHRLYPKARIEEVTDRRGYVIGYSFRWSPPPIDKNKSILGF